MYSTIYANEMSLIMIKIAIKKFYFLGMNNSDHTFSILSPSDHDEIKYLRKKCHNLTVVMKKRSGQIKKALTEIRGLKKDKESLKLQIKEKDSKIKEIFNHYSVARVEMNQKVLLAMIYIFKAHTLVVYIVVQL